MAMVTAAAVRFDVELTPKFTAVDPLLFDGYTAPDPSDESTRFGILEAPRGSYILIECSFARTGGTMGLIAGETVVRAYEYATTARMPVGMIVSSGGARLQEGFLALMQMGRTASAAAAHKAAGLRSAAAYRTPTTGGVFASWGNTADIRAASPGATIGFGGPRVVEAVTGAAPPATSHNTEAAFRDGLLDAVVEEDKHQDWIEQALGLRAAPPPSTQLDPAIPRPVHPDPWDALMSVREPSHPSGMDWAGWLAEEWTELRGSGQCFRAGVARLDESEAVVIAMERDRTLDSRALPTPADFRLAQRAIRFADASGLPLITLIDTPGANPSPISETEALAREISHTLLAMSDLRSPSVGLCVGEGGSGGAMALAHTDTLLLLDASVFAVIDPQAGAAVLYRDGTLAPELARGMRIGAGQIEQLGVVDGVLPQDRDIVRKRITAALDPGLAGARRRRPDSVTHTFLHDLSADRQE